MQEFINRGYEIQYGIGMLSLKQVLILILGVGNGRLITNPKSNIGNF